MATKDITDLQVCVAVMMSTDIQAFVEYDPEHFLMHWTGQPKKVCLSALTRAARRGLVDRSWEYPVLTKQGRKLVCPPPPTS